MKRISANKRVTALALLTAVCLLTLSTGSGAMPALAERLSDSVQWTVEDGVLTITGEGEMRKQGMLNKIYRWREPDVHTAIIQEGITVIGESSFEDCDNLRSVQIPSTVWQIDDEAFEACTGLEQVVIPDSVTEMGYWVFAECDSLKSVIIPSSVTKIRSGAFYCCEVLESAVVEQSAPVLEENTFDGCISLKSVTIGDSVTEIGLNAFEGCVSLESIALPSSVKVLQSHAFYESGLKSIYFDSVERIEYGVFQDCVNLTDVYYGGSRAQWEKIEIEEMANEYLLNATIHYNSVAPGASGLPLPKDALIIGAAALLLAVIAAASTRALAAKATAVYPAAYTERRLPVMVRVLIFAGYIVLGSAAIYYLISFLN